MKTDNRTAVQQLAFTTLMALVLNAAFADDDVKPQLAPITDNSTDTARINEAVDTKESEPAADFNNTEQALNIKDENCESESIDTEQTVVRKGCTQLNLVRTTDQNNTVEASVSGEGNLTRISVGGNNNRIVSRQSGSGNSVVIIQSGVDSQVSVQQNREETNEQSEASNEIHLQVEAPDKIEKP